MSFSPGKSKGENMTRVPQGQRQPSQAKMYFDPSRRAALSSPIPARETRPLQNLPLRSRVNVQSNRHQSGGQDSRTCHNCGAPGHISPHCPQKNQQRGQQRDAPQFNRPVLKPPQNWRDVEELKVKITLPRHWDTGTVYNFFKSFGDEPSKIDIGSVNNNIMLGTAYIFFRPPPKEGRWIGVDQDILHVDGTRDVIRSQVEPCNNQNQQEIAIGGHQLDFGVMMDEKTILQMHTVSTSSTCEFRLVANMNRMQLDMYFSLDNAKPDESNEVVRQQYRFSVPFTGLERIYEEPGQNGQISLVIKSATPPLVFSKTLDIEATHESGARFWDERRFAWFRRVAIEGNSGSWVKTTQLRSDDALIDSARWLTYRFKANTIGQDSAVQNFCKVLSDSNIKFVKRDIQTVTRPGESLWTWDKHSSHGLLSLNPGSALSALDQMSAASIHLPFEVRYQLEVCLSQGYLHEGSIKEDFTIALAALAGREPVRAMKLLEKVADMKQHFSDPMEIFRYQGQVSVAMKKKPKYCAMIRSATVTPTTIYFASPVMETSNRVIRKFSKHEDRFLRIRFKDEIHKGRIMAADDNTMEKIFDHVKQTMVHGIVIGDRHYEFLAYGNSQFRENGAYFFSSTGDTTAASIRQWMGDFSEIRIIAKYASRLGQCFSTTRAMPTRPLIERIPDLERNGFCFSDGVGKISLFLAQMIAQEMGIPSSATDCPSVFQFRLAGCKGVLTVDPNLKRAVVQVRPSQEKFPAEHSGLEICKTSQFSNAQLNQQIVLVLSALGVSDKVFILKLRNMLSDLQLAMTDEQMALKLLTKSIDPNQTSLTLASMIYDGFMGVKDPFMISCLRLWRSWNTKGLKEKARLSVDQSAFVLGCVDEYGVLKGHFNSDQPDSSSLEEESDATIDRDLSILPEIFLQIPDHDVRGKFKVIQGVCTLARNPSLHPGDVRVVVAVDKPELRHLRNCVVLPQTGDRDLASMCSGGDLDGDDYMVMWDPELLPKEWNHSPMDYSAPSPVLADGPVTVDDMTTFFVTHMKNDNLGRIATAHRYWADWLPDGVKEDHCVELAALHSKAVDYAKTGVPAEVPRHLKVQSWPHWAENKHVSRKRIHKSNKILGRLYDEVQRVPFSPAWDLPFDERILKAYELTQEELAAAKEMKDQYDLELRRIMVQFGIKSEFEVWTTYATEWNQDITDYKLAEKLGETMASFKEHHKEHCYEKAGTNTRDRDWEKLGRFVAAMYTLTAEEVSAAWAECTGKGKMVGGRFVPTRAPNVESMPFMSFPWLFQRELGEIATKTGGKRLSMTSMPVVLPVKKAPPKQPTLDFMGANIELEPLEELRFDDDISGLGTSQRTPPPASDDDGESRNTGMDDQHVVKRQRMESPTPTIKANAKEVQAVSASSEISGPGTSSGSSSDDDMKDASPEMSPVVPPGMESKVPSVQQAPDPFANLVRPSNIAPPRKDSQEAETEESEDGEAEHVVIDISETSSALNALDRLEAMMGE